MCTPSLAWLNHVQVQAHLVARHDPSALCSSRVSWDVASWLALQPMAAGPSLQLRTAEADHLAKAAPAPCGHFERHLQSCAFIL